MADDENNSNDKVSYVTSKGQSGGISAQMVNTEKNLVGDLKIDTVNQINIYHVAEGTVFRFDTLSPSTVRGAAVVGINSTEMLATGSTDSISTSANVSAVSTYTVPGGSELEIEFFNALDGEIYDVTSLQNAPKFSIEGIDPHRIKLKFDGDVPKNFIIRVDSKSKDKK